MCDDKWYCRWNRGGDRKNSIIRWLSLRMSLAAACSISILEILPLLQFYSWSETISTCTSSCRQGAVFIVPDRVASSVFFAAADIWAHKKCRSWGWDKICEGFTDILRFVEHPVIHPPAIYEVIHRFYEVIHELCPCKAHFDPDTYGGLPTAEQGDVSTNHFWMVRISEGQLAPAITNFLVSWSYWSRWQQYDLQRLEILLPSTGI